MNEPKALRSNEGKPQLSQIRFFDTALSKLAKVMEKGREKYPDSTPGVPNWTLGGKPDSEYLDAADRHITQFVNGEFYDEEMGTAHLAHAAWNLLALLENNYKGHPDEDGQFEEIQPAARQLYAEAQRDGAGDYWFKGPKGWCLWYINSRKWCRLYQDRPTVPQGMNAKPIGSQPIPQGAPWLS